MNKCELTEMEALRKELREVLGNKRYLLVMDDIWNEDRQKWDAVRSLLCSHAGSGSAIIVTSRSDQVAFIMGTLPPHRVSPLDVDQSWELLHRNTFGKEVEIHEELISVAKSTVHKCKGLPLAINTIASLLRSKHHNQWLSVLDSDVWKDDLLTTTGIVPALQLSYDHLPLEAKLCFSFCAIFPKDSPMDKDTLIHLWMANDFIASETKGQQIFDLLIWRCFLQLSVKIQKSPLSGNISNDPIDEFIHRPTTCKMHDLMHDLAESISINDCFIMHESSPSQEIMQGSSYASSLQHEVRHLLLNDASDSNTIASIKKILAPRPRTILVQKGSIDNSKFRTLRALKAFSITTPMQNLKHIRYLDCSYSTMFALPEYITILYCLQTLKLIGCKELKKLPEGMRYMISLRHIFLLGCHRLERMPQGIGQLNSLQTLTSYVIDTDASGRGIDQLKYFNLGGDLSLTELRKVGSTENAKQANMSTKHSLKQLSLDWANGRYSTNVMNIFYGLQNNAEGVLEALRPHKNLEVLQLRNYKVAKLASWMHNSTMLEHLNELSLVRCKNCKDLPPLWKLPSLVYLCLCGLDSLTSICTGNDGRENVESCVSPPTFFPKLKTMIVSNMPKLERWHQEVAGQVAVVSFPQLQNLMIVVCPMLASMPKRIPLLEALVVFDATNIPLYHLMNLSVQSNLECTGHIWMPTVGWKYKLLIFSRHGDSKLDLRLKGLTENLERFEEELNIIPCRFIKKFNITHCDCLFSSEPSQIQRNIWNHFRFVEFMAIKDCSNIVQSLAVAFRNLNRLRVLVLIGCSNLMDSLPSTISDDAIVPRPHLRDDGIVGCGNLMEVPKLPAYLQELAIRHFPKLLSMPTNLGNIEKLREVEVIGCDALTKSSDGIYGVTLLKELWLVECPRLETLPEVLLQQLPGLKKLVISECPTLEGAFSRDGAYWDLVEAIPDIIVCRSHESNA